jgi:dihydropteroate synthase
VDLLQSKPVSMTSMPRTHNAHVLDGGDPQDVRQELERVGVAPETLTGLAERLCGLFIRLEDVPVSLANTLKALLPPLGLTLAMHREAEEGARPRTGLLLAGSRGGLQELAGALRGKGAGPAELGAEIESCLAGRPLALVWGHRRLDFGERTRVMGVLNCTPDSFYPGSRRPEPEVALQEARGMIACGADIVDVGGESTRPGSDPVDAEEEARRVLPVIQAIRRESEVLISIDTRKREVAERALEAGADMVNDVSGLRDNPELAALVARAGVPVVLMHMRGEPKTMQASPHYEDPVGEILRELRERIRFALQAGVPAEHIIIDPGIGFGKRCEDNLAILRHLRSFGSLGRPVLIGLSRKSFLGTVTGGGVEQRLAATIAANTLAIVNGADILRVHDVKEAVDTVRLVSAVRRLSC